MSQKLAVAVPRLASTILLLAQNPCPSSAGAAAASHAHDGTTENDIHVLMMKRHGKARFMPSVYVFPGGGVDVADYHVAQRYLAQHYNVHSAPDTSSATEAAAASQSFMEAKVSPTREEGETEAWACRVGALRELAEEAACVLQRDGTVCTAAQWQMKSAAAKTSQSSDFAAKEDAHLSRSLTAPDGVYDAAATPLLRPVGRWVTPRHFKYRYDTYFYAALVRGAADAATTTTRSLDETLNVHEKPSAAAVSLRPAQTLTLTAQASEVEDLLWLSPLEALRRHENKSDTFSLAPPTFLLLHALARQPSYAALAQAWATTKPSDPAASAGAGEGACGAKPVGTLPYSSVLPCVEPRSYMSKDKKYIADFLLPEHYLYERGWSEPAGPYRFCGEAFADERHEIRMWVGEEWGQKAKADGADVSSVAARELTHTEKAEA